MRSKAKLLMFVLAVAFSGMALTKPGVSVKPLTVKFQDQFVYTSPVVADLMHNGSFEIIAAGTQQVYVLNPDLTALDGWPKELLRTEGVSVCGTPAVGDVEGTGHEDIVAVTKGDGGILKVFVWDYQGIVVPGWPQTVRGIIDYGASPVIADLEGNGKKEIIFTASLPEANGNPGVVYVFQSNGKVYPGWPQQVPPVQGSSQWLSTPAVGPLEKGDSPAIIVATINGQVLAWDPTGKPLEHWPVQAERGDRFYVAPILADIDRDGSMEIVVGSCNDNQEGNFYVWRSDGSPAKGWPRRVPSNIQSEAAVGDLEGDGGIDIVFGTNVGSRVYAFRANGLMVKGWPQKKGESYFCNYPILVDLKGESKSSVIIGAMDQKIFNFQSDGNLAPGWPQLLGEQNSSLRAPAVATREQDRYYSLVYLANDSISLWKMPKPHLKKGKKSKTPDWPMFRYSPDHAGVWPLTEK